MSFLCFKKLSCWFWGFLGDKKQDKFKHNVLHLFHFKAITHYW